MTQLTVGKFRGIQQCSSLSGTFTSLALDHRQNLRKVNHAFEDNTELSRFKMDVITSLSDQATSVLLDPEVSAAQAISTGALIGKMGLVVALESTGYGGSPFARQSQILPGWSVEKAKRMGADMVKLLVYYHPDSPTAIEIEEFVRRVADECARYDIALMLEPLSYSLSGEKKLPSTEKYVVVVETVSRLMIPGVDILKAEFPLDVTVQKDDAEWSSACKAISDACPAPWIVLSAAVDFETYLHQVEIACRAGASGCAVGRAVWQEAVLMEGKDRLEFLQTVGRERLSHLNKLCSKKGKPFGDFYTTETPFDWYITY